MFVAQISGFWGKKISKGEEEAGEGDYVHDSRLSHCHAGTNVLNIIVSCLICLPSYSIMPTILVIFIVFVFLQQVWAYEAVPEIGKRFGQRVGERMPRLLSWSAQK